MFDDEDSLEEARKQRYHDRQQNKYSCPDRMCGADDCYMCHPENFRGGTFIDDMLEDVEEEDNL